MGVEALLIPQLVSGFKSFRKSCGCRFAVENMGYKSPLAASWIGVYYEAAHFLLEADTHTDTYRLIAWLG